ncbi:MAG: hypothetical protein JO317_04690 [Verrucomicrobiae bacterium]|nr:hypothetical protein [Verrucomicrobiae bacterium]
MRVNRTAYEFFRLVVLLAAFLAAVFYFWKRSGGKPWDWITTTAGVAASGRPEDQTIADGVYSNRYFAFRVATPRGWLAANEELRDRFVRGVLWRNDLKGGDPLGPDEHFLMMLTKQRLDLYGQQNNVFLLVLAGRVAEDETEPSLQPWVERKIIDRFTPLPRQIIAGPEAIRIGGRAFRRIHYRVPTSTVGLSHEFIVYSTILNGYNVTFISVAHSEADALELTRAFHQIAFDR